MTVNSRTLFRRHFAAARTAELRPMLEFAEAEIVIPSGPFEGLKFRSDRQPFVRHWFNAVDSGLYSEMVITGPSQSGKTLVGFVIPLLYHLFEVGETVIAAVPDRDIAADKWEQDIEPVLARTRYRDLLPSSGSGSKGGRSASIKFRNGTILRWMTAGGGDKSRAAFTSRVVCFTETDGFDIRTSTSDEADKIKQIEARTRSYPRELRRIYKECTLTTDLGHTWQRYSQGTKSRLVLPCAHCGEFVSPERDDLVGWKGADSEEVARRASAFYCPSCGEQWDEEQRREANAKSLIVHRGQQVEDGHVTGEHPATRTLGFRWSAVNNMLVPAGDIGADEWQALRAVDEDNAERELCQFVWAIPYQPKDIEHVDLDIDKLKRRTCGRGRGQVADDTKWITIGVDVNKPVLHWTAVAWRANGSSDVIDYGRQGVRARQSGFDLAIVEALTKLYGKLGDGWSAKTYHRVMVDCRWSTDEIVAAIRKLNDRRWRPFMGLGQGHWKKRYLQPEKINGDVVWLGNCCYEKVMQKHRCIFTFADANWWKTWLHDRLAINEFGDEERGVMRLYAAVDTEEHLEFVRHLTAEKEVQRFEQKHNKGYVKEWETIRSANHWLDATYMACVAGHRSGFKVVDEKPRTRPAVARPVQRPVGGASQPFVATPYNLPQR